MKLSTLLTAAVLGLYVTGAADALFLTSLALLPITAITSLGGIAGLKLALAMTILGMLGWWNVSRYGVGLRAGIESSKLPDGLVPLPKPKSIFSGPTISIPIAALPYFLGGRVQRPLSIRLPVKDFVMLVNATTQFDTAKVNFSTRGSASVKGIKGSALHASGTLRSPLLNVESQQKATLRGRRSIEGDPQVIKDAVNLVHELDRDRCILRLSCEVSADASSYGPYGRRVASFMRSLEPIGRDLAFVDFEKAYRQGRSYGMPGCTQTYSSCKVDLKALVAFVQSS
ncbi:uncharacterized protein [Dermacentor albipictus]|uniref:uncharacterized protein n=1 Tax=Dermacentor albipictus TaxID=60249 RepID=UPI0038FC48A4